MCLGNAISAMLVRHFLLELKNVPAFGCPDLCVFAGCIYKGRGKTKVDYDYL